MRIFMIVVGVLFSANLLAADGSSGCGPGWYVFKENSLVSSALRATTNIILVPVVTIGMTFGTSNCSRHKIVKKEQESLHFVTMNYFELKREIAKGQGQYTRALANVIGCSPSALTRAEAELHKSYSKIFPDYEVDPKRALLETYKVIFSDQELTQQCALNIG